MNAERTLNKRSLAARIVRIILIFFGCCLGLIILASIAIQTAPVQQLVKNKVVGYLRSKLHSNISIGRISVIFPKDIIIDNIFLADHSNDTLFYAERLSANLELFKLLRGKVEVKSFALSVSTVKIKRAAPDTSFNFQFIVDAFGSTGKNANKQPHSNDPIAIHHISIDRFNAVFKDNISGDDDSVEIKHLSFDAKTVDLAKLQIADGALIVSSLYAKIVRHRAQAAISKTIDTGSSVRPILQTVALRLSDIRLDYLDLPMRSSYNMTLDDFLVRANSLDFEKNSAVVGIVKASGGKIRVKKGHLSASVAKNWVSQTQQMKAVSSQSWNCSLQRLQLDKFAIAFDDENRPYLKNSIDYAHLNLQNIRIKADDLDYTNNAISLKLNDASLEDSAILALQELSGAFSYSNKQSTASDLVLRTPLSFLSGNIKMNYAAEDSILAEPASVNSEINVSAGTIAFSDLIKFDANLSKVPFFKDPKTVVQFGMMASGNLVNLHVGYLRVKGLSDTRLEVDGNVSSIIVPGKMNLNLNIHELRTTKNDLIAVLPHTSIPSNIGIPDTIFMTGKLKGSVHNIFTDLKLQTSSGAISVNGQFKNINSLRTFVYDFNFHAEKLNLRRILGNVTPIDQVTLTASAKGMGLEMLSAVGNADVSVESVGFRQKIFTGLQMHAELNHQTATWKGEINDPKISLSLRGSANLNSRAPSVRGYFLIKGLDARELGLSKSSLVYAGKVDLDFSDANPDSVAGSLIVSNSVIYADSQKISMDTVRLDAGRTDSGRYLQLTSEILNARLQGKYKLTALNTIAGEIFDTYYSNKVVEPSGTPKNFNFSLSGTIQDRPFLQKIIPDLKELKTVHFDARYTSPKFWSANLLVPGIRYGDNQLTNLGIDAEPSGRNMNINLHVGLVKSGKTVALYNTSIETAIANSSINFKVGIQDKAARVRYSVAGLLVKEKNLSYSLSIDPKKIILNYDDWNIDKANLVSFSGGDIKVSDFNLRRNGEKLSVEGESSKENSQLHMDFSNFLLSTFTAAAGSDSVKVNGVVNGEMSLSGGFENAQLASNLNISNMSINNDTLGDLSIKIEGVEKSAFTTTVHLTGRGNDILLHGSYSNQTSQADLDLKMSRIHLASIKGAFMGAVQRASGSAVGNLHISGSLKSPNIVGKISFDSAEVTPTALGAGFSVDKQTITIDHGVYFNQFTILDSEKNKLVLNGSVSTSDYKHFSLGVSVSARNYRAINTSRVDNQLYYGKLYFDCNLNLRGTETKPVIDGSLRIDEKTNLTITLPEDEPEVQERQGVVEFVNKKEPESDSSLRSQSRDTSQVFVHGIDVSTSIIIDSNATLNLIIDPDNGDQLTVKGRGTLTGGIDQSGRTSFSGTYQLSNGFYNLSFSILKKRFDIQNGSTITWTGEATKADLDINAILIVNTAPIDLVDDQLSQSAATIRNTYLQKLPFEIHLHVGGELMKPKIGFDIVLPEDKSFSVSKDVVTLVQGKLSMLRLDSGELNKQVFALLLLNRFVGEDPFASEQAGLNAESLARSSVSKILTQQLNHLASSLVKGVDVNFDLQSTDDYTTGQLQNRTDLNVNLSKRLLNDRLTLTVGSDFELEGPQNVGSNQGSELVGNLGVAYKLSKDGRYILRAYRKNDYDDIVEGYVIETGLGFIITVDYDRFSQVFRRKEHTKNQ